MSKRMRKRKNDEQKVVEEQTPQEETRQKSAIKEGKKAVEEADKLLDEIDGMLNEILDGRSIDEFLSSNIQKGGE